MNYIRLFGFQFDINRVAFTIPIGDGWDVYWYGILIATGLLLAVIYAMKRAKSFGINADDLLTAAMITAVLSIASARLYFVIFSDLTLADFFKIHDGGLAIPGALLGAVVFGAICCKIFKIDILAAFDLTTIGFFIGQAIGRWGNFVNQEAYGEPTGSSWFGMTGDIIAKGVDSLGNSIGVRLVHPCFLYESIWCILGFVLLHILSYHRKFDGELSCIYMIWYGAGRAVIEGLRTDALMLGSVRVTQWLCAAAAIAGVVLLFVGFANVKKRAKLAGEHYETQFDEIMQDEPEEKPFESTLGITDEEYIEQNSKKDDENDAD